MDQVGFRFVEQSDLLLEITAVEIDLHLTRNMRFVIFRLRSDIQNHIVGACLRHFFESFWVYVLNRFFGRNG